MQIFNNKTNKIYSTNFKIMFDVVFKWDSVVSGGSKLFDLWIRQIRDMESWVIIVLIKLGLICKHRWIGVAGIHVWLPKLGAAGWSTPLKSHRYPFLSILTNDFATLAGGAAPIKWEFIGYETVAEEIWLFNYRE